MKSLSFTVKENTIELVSSVLGNESKREIQKELLVSVLQTVLSEISPQRDYSSVSSMRKLFRVLDIEMSPDDSDDDDEPPPVLSSTVKKSVPPVKPALKKPVMKKPLVKKEVVPKKETSDDESSSG